MPQSTTQGLHPIIHVPNYMDRYLFTDPWAMDGWVGHVGWPIVDVWPTKWSSVQLAVWRRIGKVRLPRPAFYPLCYAANSTTTSLVLNIDELMKFLYFAALPPKMKRLNHSTVSLKKRAVYKQYLKVAILTRNCLETDTTSVHPCNVEWLLLCNVCLNVSDF